MNVFTCPFPLLQRLLLALAEDRRRVAYLPVGARHSGATQEWLAREPILTLPDAPLPAQAPLLRLSVSSDAPPVTVNHLARTRWPPSIAGHLFLGEGAWRAQLWGVVRTGETMESLQQLRLVGSGMHVVPLLNPFDPQQQPAATGRIDFFTRQRWSRTMGALGGQDIWRRLTNLRMGIVGCGRTGSLVAATLVRLGVRHLTLVDPDLVEIHNLGEMDVVTDADLGRPKAEALADQLRFQPSRFATTLLPLVAPVTAPTAREAVKECDVLFCCADNDAARLATAILATMYHKVLVDIGTGVFFRAVAGAERAQSATRTMGADVRLVLPGQGCLLCVGNLTNYRQAIEDLCNHRQPTTLQPNWREQRAGSLRTLNQLAAALGVQMLQDLVAERIVATTWTQIECNDIGRMAVNYPAVRQQMEQAACALCAKAGLGDEGLWWR